MRMPISSQRRRAAIIGGSMGGLFAANLLRRSGWEVQVFERIGSELSGRGAGIVTHPELFDALSVMGIDIRSSADSITVAGRRVIGANGKIVGELALPQVLMSWGALHARLRATIPDECYRAGLNLVSISEHAEAVTAHFQDGSSWEADVLIGADGITSTVRQGMCPSAKPSYVGYIAWRGLVDEELLSQQTRDAICNHFVFSLPIGEQMLGYPVMIAGEDGKERRQFNFVWYRPADEGVLANLLTATDGTRQPLSITPTLIRREVIEAMRRDADTLLAPQFAEAVRKTDQPFIQAIQDLETPRMRLSDRCVVLGDAAFVARPHLGMGVTKAAGDAVALARWLNSSGDAVGPALEGFSGERSAFGAAVVRRARELGAYMQAQNLTDDEKRMAERHRRPEAIMAETAVATGIAA
jgi:2-polyprenyl-6-methoxyphenol hydroxylase-like FAD-dependent oxidoreductase